MFTTKKLLVILAVALPIALAAVVFAPALIPQADPAEQVAGEDADSDLKAQTAGSSGASISNCQVGDMNIRRTEYSDGSELWRFSAGHTLSISAPKAGTPRNATATYADGSGRVEQFGASVKTPQMPNAQPLSDKWYDAGGRPQPSPGFGEYPDLWFGVEEFFGGASEAQHPWDDIDEDWKRIRPPSFDPGDQDIFGPIIRREKGPEFERVWFADGTWRWDYLDRPDRIYEHSGRFISVEWISELRLHSYNYWTEEEWEPPAMGCFDDNRGKPFRKVEYADGVTRYMVFAKGTKMEDSHRIKPLCEMWRDADGNEIPPRDDPVKYDLRPMVRPSLN